jgi:hypothetical protein
MVFMGGYRLRRGCSGADSPDADCEPMSLAGASITSIPSDEMSSSRSDVSCALSRC